ncbi:hypothetical protein M758_UG213000 [Ceratodon purpureus]|nr:hypothetical protein M758_UG213000 [Ceratodon purpureus]
MGIVADFFGILLCHLFGWRVSGQKQPSLSTRLGFSRLDFKVLASLLRNPNQGLLGLRFWSFLDFYVFWSLRGSEGSESDGF